VRGKTLAKLALHATHVLYERLLTPNGLLHIALGLLLVGCSSVSPSTGKSTIRNVDVAHEVEPRQVLVGLGDEVQWRNTLTEPIVISFPSSVANRISCNTGFKTEEHIALSALIEPNSSASLCFANQGKYNYQVRLSQNLASALRDKRAIVWVGRGERTPDPYEEYTNITP
jgi:plastocyanin